MADESSLWAAKNKLQDLREQFEGVKSRLELTLDNATAILEEADDNLKHAEEGLHGDAASRPGTVRGTVRLCDSCKEIDIPNVFAALSKLKPDTEQRHLANARRTVGDLRHAVEVEDYCCLCKFLLEAILLQTAKGSFTIPPGQNEHATSIRLVSDSDPWFVTAGISVNLPPCQFGWLRVGARARSDPSICITFEPAIDSGHGTESRNLVYPNERRRLYAFNGSLDIELVISWINKCEDVHGSLCCPTELDNTEGLTVIDVDSRAIVPYPHGERYVALSYVWGSDQSTQSLGSRPRPVRLSDNAGQGYAQVLPSKTPQTFEDAIRVTKELGVRYLWIDLFCINQDDREEQQRQIALMDQIFSSAWLTIACLDGPNARYGLPGVSRPFLYTRQPKVELSSGRLTATYVHSWWDDNGKSRWDSRAWTLQERLLSRRLLTFADTYIAMSCRTEYFHDLLSVDNLTSAGGTSQIGDKYYREDGSEINLEKLEWDFQQYSSLVADYTHREITWENDRYNACRGSLNRMTARTGVQFHWALPKVDLLKSLLWKPHHGYVNSRCPEFPSWSWLGWSGWAEYAYWIHDQTATPPNDPTKAAKQHQHTSNKRRRLEDFSSPGEYRQEATILELSHVGEDVPPDIALRTSLCMFQVRFLRRAGAPHLNRPSNTQQAKFAVGDHWGLVARNGDLLRNPVGEHQNFEPTDVAFRLHPAHSQVLRNQNNRVELMFVKHWLRIWDSDRIIENMVSALVVVKRDDGRSYWRLSSVLIPASEWYTRNPDERDIILT